jgi:hypothetical protein
MKPPTLQIGDLLLVPVQQLIGAAFNDIESRLELGIDAECHSLNCYAGQGWTNEVQQPSCDEEPAESVFLIPSSSRNNLSVIAACLATTWNPESGFCTIYISRRTNKTTFPVHFLAHNIGAEVVNFAAGRISDTQWDDLTTTLGKVHDHPFYFVQSLSLSLRELDRLFDFASRATGLTPQVFIDDSNLLSMSPSLSDWTLDQLNRIALAHDALLGVVVHRLTH